MRRFLPNGQSAYAAVYQSSAWMPLLSGGLEGRTISSEIPRENELGRQLVRRSREPAGRPRAPDHVGVDLRLPPIQDANGFRLVGHHEFAACSFLGRGRTVADASTRGNRALAI